MPERHVTDTPYQPRDPRDIAPPQPRPPVPTQRTRTARAIGVLMMVFGVGWLLIALHESAPAPAEVDVAPADQNQLISQTYPTRNIAFDISSGDVTISTWDEKTTQVEVFYEGGEPADYDVRPQTQGDTLTIQGGPKAFLPVGGDRQITYHITIPQDGSVTVKNVTGDTSITDVQGPVKVNVSTGQIHAERLGHGLSATTTTGDIQIDGLRGPLTAQSTTGSITLSDGEVSDASVTTVAGNIELTGIAGKIALENSTGLIRVSDAKDTVLSIQTVSGDIDFDGSLATKAKHTLNTVSGSVQMRIPEKSDLVLHAGTSSGGINIDSDLNLQKREDNQFSQSGVLGDGGAELEINTVSGGITVDGE